MDSHLLSTDGIESVGPAALFTALYVILTLLYIWKTSRNPAHAFITLVIFCICESLSCAAGHYPLLRTKEFA